MKTLFLLLVVSASAFAAPFTLSKAAFDNHAVPFLPHIGSAPMSNYLAMNLRFEPFNALREQVEQRLGVKLKQRGEAHITTVSPVEYDNALRAKISINDINILAARRRIQTTPYSVVCVGRGRALIEGKEAYTYFAVVSAPGLVALREDIAQVFARRGGSPKAFSPRYFYPHVTLGFTDRDLHDTDGVIKDRRSCWENIVTQ